MPDDTDRSAGQLLADNRSLAEEIVYLGEENRILQAIADAIPGTEVSSIQNAFKFENPEDTGLIRISAYSGTPQKAYTLAHTAAEQVIAVLDDELGVKNLKVFSQADLPESPNNIKPMNDLLLGSAFGFGLGLLVLLIVFLNRPDNRPKDGVLKERFIERGKRDEKRDEKTTGENS